MNKKEFQKVITAIRNDISAEKGSKVRFPKAMMTVVQEERRTATVNCGGEWGTPESTKALADRVLTDIRFVKLMKDSTNAHIEANNFGGFQIRVNW